MFFKPHSASVYPKSATVGGNERTGYSEGSAATVACHIIEKTPQQAAEMFGEAGQNPAVLLCETASTGSIKIGYRLVANGLTYRVMAGPMLSNAGGVVAVANHATYLLERDV